ncbi:MAG: hypothetical protein VZR53_08875 [Prevotella sp.]|nr:hypothetical protein [Prevotella sp.]
MGIFDQYPYTDFHEMNLDFILKLAKDSMGLHLENSGKKLLLKNANGETVSQVEVAYAKTALLDDEGNEISTYLVDVSSVGTTLAFVNGKGEIKTVTVPYSVKSSQDPDGKEIEDYVFNIQVAGDKLKVSKGDGTIVELVIPFAVKASQDSNGKAIDTYAAALVVDGNNIRLNDSHGNQLSSITVPFATKAAQDSDGDDLKTYARAMQAGTTTVKLLDKSGNTLSEIIVPYAAHAANAIETVSISGNQVIFTTYSGQQTAITVPYSVKSSQDDLGNEIKTTYVANVTQDAQTGELVFQDATGGTVATLEITAAAAIEDDFGNTIADYIKQLIVSQNSDYVQVVHGTGVTDTLVIHYAETAWKDTNGNVIKNFYIGRIAIVEAPANSGVFYLVCYNGDTPEAELFRIKLVTVTYDAQNMNINITIGGI